MKRYLDIIRQMKLDRKTPPPVGSSHNYGERINEINEKSTVLLQPGMQVRWNRASTGKILLVSTDGWAVVQYDPSPALVFLRGRLVSEG